MLILNTDRIVMTGYKRSTIIEEGDAGISLNILALTTT